MLIYESCTTCPLYFCVGTLSFRRWGGGGGGGGGGLSVIRSLLFDQFRDRARETESCPMIGSPSGKYDAILAPMCLYFT